MVQHRMSGGYGASGGGCGGSGAGASRPMTVAVAGGCGGRWEQPPDVSCALRELCGTEILRDHREITVRSPGDILGRVHTTRRTRAPGSSETHPGPQGSATDEPG